MNRLILLSLSVVAATKADTKVELKNSAIVPLLRDKPRWKEIVNCLLDRGPCGKYQVLKDSVFQIHGDCDFCHTKQRDVVMKGKEALSERYPRDMEKIHRRYAKLLMKNN